MFSFHATRTLRAARTIAAASMIALVATACSDDPTHVEEEPEVATMRIIVGNDTVNVNAKTGAVTGGPIMLTTGQDAAVTVQFLGGNGVADPLVQATTFRLDVTPASTAAATFTRTGPFTGTLRGVQAGNTSVSFALLHLEHDHEEFKWPVSVTVSAQ